MAIRGVSRFKFIDSNPAIKGVGKKKPGSQEKHELCLIISQGKVDSQIEAKVAGKMEGRVSEGIRDMSRFEFYKPRSTITLKSK